MMEFGEAIMLMRANTKGKDKFDSRWEQGVWLGIREDSGESIIGTSAGVIKARTIGRREIAAERWNIQLFYGFKGAPWQPVPGRSGDEIRVRASVPDTRTVDAPRQSPEESIIRRVRTTKEMAISTGSCQDAQYATQLRGMSQRNHIQRHAGEGLRTN